MQRAVARVLLRVVLRSLLRVGLREGSRADALLFYLFEGVYVRGNLWNMEAEGCRLSVGAYM